MQMLIQPKGSVLCLYGEELDLHCLGRLTINRGIHVEPTDDGQSCSRSRHAAFRILERMA